MGVTCQCPLDYTGASCETCKPVHLVYFLYQISLPKCSIHTYMYPTAWALSIVFKETALGIFAIYRGISMSPIYIPCFLSDDN